jgi:FkbM family methyltransferase
MNSVKPFDFQVNFYGLKYCGDLSRHIDWHVYFYGAYEKQDLYLLRDLIKDISNPVFLDIGANVGMHSLYMSKYCQEIHAFEPLPSVLGLFREKTAMNDLQNIHVHEIALGDEDKELEFYAPAGRNVGSGSFISEHEKDNNRPFGKIRVYKGDEYLEGLKLKNIDLVKIDVEGFEKYVLKGMQNTIRQYRPAIVMEFHQSTFDSFVSANEFTALIPDDYEFYKIDTNITRGFFFNRNEYKLSPFKFEEPGYFNILLKPRQ